MKIRREWNIHLISKTVFHFTDEIYRKSSVEVGLYNAPKLAHVFFREHRVEERETA